MDIQYLENSGRQSLLVKISGDCDMYSAQEFFSGVTEKINSGFISIYLDFSGVVYLDSSGVGAIIKILRQSKEKKVDLKFRGINGTPRKVLRMSNILTLIKEEV
jgi:anti-sigma B factor antagonist